MRNLDHRERLIVKAIRQAIRADKKGEYLHPGYKKDLGNPYAGYCYVASEAFIHMIRRKGYRPMCMRVEVSTGSLYDLLYRTFTTHWFVQAPDGRVIDPTIDQFDKKPPHHLAVGKGFLTKKPSTRGAALIKAARRNGQP
jgi:hypothetical protein